MRAPVTLVTGAGGEIGHGLIAQLARSGRQVVTIDIAPLPPELSGYVAREFTGSITDPVLLERVLAQFEVDLVFHLAALLSTRSEFTPLSAHQVNVDGTLNLLEFAQREGESHGRPVVFVYPSSIAVYGFPDLEARQRAGAVAEDDFNAPQTMYGCNKLYCEHLGRYYARHYKQLAADVTPHVDFRCVRFPGLISSETTPAGGTSDYAAEMLHAAARGVEYRCFVRRDTRIPLMVMADAVDALLKLALAPDRALTRAAYNTQAFIPTAAEIQDVVVAAFPDARIEWVLDAKRQRILDSWPEQVDDRAARQEWGFAPRYDFSGAFSDYLIPRIRERYGIR
jgi:nucleoside-diphosphate-sugar epimerase